MRSLCLEVKHNELIIEDISEESISQRTSTGKLGLADPDLILRSSGEQRLSNFLLWQCAYAEFAVIDSLCTVYFLSSFRVECT